MFSHFDPRVFLVSLIVTVLSISLHEFGHAISADKCGDPTPRREGRITLWPDKHFDPVGFLMIMITSIAGRGIGWGKPVMVRPSNFGNPRRDMVIVAACGPVMNLLLAIVFGIVLRVMVATNHANLLVQHNVPIGSTTTAYDLLTVPGLFLVMFVLRNLGLMFFNLIPIHPLDGSKIMGGFLPVNLSIQYDRFMGQFGPLLLMLVCFMSPGDHRADYRPAGGRHVSYSGRHFAYRPGAELLTRN